MDVIPVTSSFGQEPSDILGYLTTSPEGVNVHADLLWRLYKQNPEAFEIVPAYSVKEDGTHELIELSLCPKQKAPSMALDDLLDDLE